MRRLRQKGKGMERGESAGEGAQWRGLMLFNPRAPLPLPVTCTQNVWTAEGNRRSSNYTWRGHKLMTFIIWVENESERQPCEEQQGTEMWREHRE